SGLDELDPYARDAASHDAEDTRCSVGQVDLPARHVRPAVVDRHHHRAAVEQVGDPDPAAERECTVGPGQLGRVVALAARGGAPSELLAVPRSVPDDGLLD